MDNLIGDIVIGLAQALISLWKLWLMLGIVYGVLLFIRYSKLQIEKDFKSERFKKGEKWRNERDLLYWLRGMKPSEFEEYIADLFRRRGFTTKTVGGRSDGGIDVIATKDGVKHYIQCKKFITSKVGVGDVRNFYGALADHLADGKGYFITTNVFTLEAEQFVEDKPIELIDGQALVRLIRSVEKKSKASTASEASENASLMCPECGGKLVVRNGKHGEFYGCSNFPKCRYTKEKR